MVQEGHRRGNAHHVLTDKGEDGEKGNKLGIKMQHMDLVMRMHDIEEGGERGGGTRPAHRASTKNGTSMAVLSMEARDVG